MYSQVEYNVVYLLSYLFKQTIKQSYFGEGMHWCLVNSCMKIKQVMDMYNTYVYNSLIFF